jgi:hypothetical protein
MKPPALLLFLEFEGVLVLAGSAKRDVVADTVSDIARGNSTWRDHQVLWTTLFEAEPLRQLKALHNQFQLQYCLTTDWTGFLDKAAMLNVLHLSGLGFVAGNLHARWEVDQGHRAVRTDQIKTWLHLNSDWQDRWLALDSDVRGPGVQNWPKELTDFAVFCCSDAGLTQFEADAISARYLGRIASS